MPSHVQTATGSGQGYGPVVPVTLEVMTTAGNCLVAVIGSRQRVESITLGGSSDSWAELVSQTDGSVTGLYFWADPNCAGGQTSIVVNLADADTAAIAVYEFSGVLSASPLDQSSVGYSASAVTSFTSGATETTTDADEVWVGGVAAFETGDFTVGSPWTGTPVTGAIVSGSWLMAAWQVVAATGEATYAGTLASNTYNAGVITLTPAPQSNIIPPPPANFPETAVDYDQLGQVTAPTLAPFLYAPRESSGPWTPAASGAALAIAIYDPTPDGNLPIHLTEDDGAKITTLVEVPAGGQLSGCLEATTLPAVPVNQNPDFTTGTDPWTAEGATITQSTAVVRDGYTDSGLLTPDGSSSQAVATSESFTVVPLAAYVFNAWLYSTDGWAQVTLTAQWQDLAGNPLDADAVFIVSLAAATWTQVSGIIAAPPGAARAVIQVAEAGTSPDTALLYMVAVFMQPAWPGHAATVAQIGYDPDTGLPVTVTQLA